MTFAFFAIGRLPTWRTSRCLAAAIRTRPARAAVAMRLDAGRRAAGRNAGLRFGVAFFAGDFRGAVFFVAGFFVAVFVVAGLRAAVFFIADFLDGRLFNDGFFATDFLGVARFRVAFGVADFFFPPFPALDVFAGGVPRGFLALPDEPAAFVLPRAPG